MKHRPKSFRTAETAGHQRASTLRPSNRDGRVVASDFIKQHMEVRRAPELPELQLYSAQPTSGLWRLARHTNDLPPYWAYDWAGGTVLARYILDHPETVKGLRVLDLGSGSGVVAIAAAKAGAAEVIAADIDENAVTAAMLNAELNHVKVIAKHRDIAAGPPPSVDLILAGDVFYDESLSGSMTTLFDACVASGIQVLIGDPGRLHLPWSRLRLVAEYTTRDFGDVAGAPSKQASVFSFIAEDRN